MGAGGVRRAGHLGADRRSGPALAADASRDIRVDSSGDVRSTPHLAGWLAHPPRWLTAAVLVSLGVLALSFVGHQALRLAAGHRRHRQQLKWLAFGAVVTIVLGVLAPSFTPGIVSQISAPAIAALPVSIGIGILRYRLYDVDRVISRTLAYAIVTGLLVGVYVAVVLLTTQVLQFHASVAVATSTLVAAALFNPLRRRVQRAVDRRIRPAPGMTPTRSWPRSRRG